MTTGDAEQVTNDGTFKKTLVRVLIVQVVALALLWALQARYPIF